MVLTSSDEKKQGGDRLSVTPDASLLTVG